MSAVRTPCRLLSGQEWSNLAPTRWRQRWQSRKGKRIRALKRHCRQGGVETKRATELARELLPITVPEVHRLVYRLIWQPRRSVSASCIGPSGAGDINNGPSAATTSAARHTGGSWRER